MVLSLHLRSSNVSLYHSNNNVWYNPTDRLGLKGPDRGQNRDFQDVRPFWPSQWDVTTSISVYFTLVDLLRGWCLLYK